MRHREKCVMVYNVCSSGSRCECAPKFFAVISQAHTTLLPDFQTQKPLTLTYLMPTYPHARFLHTALLQPLLIQKLNPQTPAYALSVKVAKAGKDRLDRERTSRHNHGRVRSQIPAHSLHRDCLKMNCPQIKNDEYGLKQG